MKKILIIRLSSMGDIVFTTPVVRALKKQAQVEIHYLLKEQYAQLLEHNPYIDKLIPYHEDRLQLVSQLKKEGYDLVVDLHNSIRSKQIRNRLRVPTNVIKKHSFEKYLLIYGNIDRLPKNHMADRCFTSLKSITVTNDGKGMDFFFPESYHMQLPSTLSASPYVALVLGATHFTKRIPLDKLEQLISSIEKPIALIGGPDVMELAQTLAEAKVKNIVNGVGQWDITESAYVIHQSELVIAPDTGMMHIAAALKKPIVSVWGSTVPEFGVYPYYGKVAIDNLMIQSKLSCRPCSKHGNAKCPKGHFKCMKELNVDQIIGYVNNFSHI